MKLFNKIILTDLVLTLVIMSLFFLPNDSLRDGESYRTLQNI